MPVTAEEQGMSVGSNGAAEFRRTALQSAISNGLLSDRELLAGFVDVAAVSATIRDLKQAFPNHFAHTFAAKANSLRAALSLVRSNGIGCEVASRGELAIALESGFTPAQLVYDEPAKTQQVLRQLLDLGIAFNIDNWQEFERVAALCATAQPDSRIGLRINPQVGSGTIGAMSTATATSKFGFALDDPGNRQRIVDAYCNHRWLTSLHTHIGSQGCSLDLIITGIRKVVDLANEVNRCAKDAQIRVLDIGGGLPVNFDDDTVTPTFADYAARLQGQVPELFSGEFAVKTEFGRSIFAKNGFIATRVEYTKEAGGRVIAITHAGAQTATRTAFLPQLWPIRLSVFDAAGNEKHDDLVEQDVAGPCCFAGDLLAQKRLLPRICAGDYVLLHDTGAYYFSNPFFYNNLPPIAVYGVNPDASFDVWRKQPSLEKMHEVMS